MSEQRATLAMPRTMNLDDETLIQRVYGALVDIKPLCVLGSPLHIQVKDGVVTLRGVVATHLCKMQILQTVGNVPGVKQVIDKLWV